MILYGFRFRAVEDRATEDTQLFFVDDKAKVHVGNPGLAVSTGVRGKKSLCPTQTTLNAADHDMIKCTVTPSVILDCEVPDDPHKSFLRGKVSFKIINLVVFCNQ